MRETMKAEKSENLCCQTSTTVRPSGTDRVYDSTLSCTTVRSVGTTVRAVRTSILAFFSLFTLFYFELAFGEHMKVLDKDISFLMDLVLLKNDFYILSFSENTPSRSWCNFTKIQHNYFLVNPKATVRSQTPELDY
jgi:hypothetical protein